VCNCWFINKIWRWWWFCCRRRHHHRQFYSATRKHSVERKPPPRIATFYSWLYTGIAIVNKEFFNIILDLIRGLDPGTLVPGRDPDCHQKCNRLVLGPRLAPLKIHQNSFITGWDVQQCKMPVDAPSANGKQTWKMIQDPRKNPDCHQNLNLIDFSVLPRYHRLSTKFHRNPFITFWDILHKTTDTHRIRRKYYLLGGGQNVKKSNLWKLLLHVRSVYCVSLLLVIPAVSSVRAVPRHIAGDRIRSWRNVTEVVFKVGQKRCE